MSRLRSLLLVSTLCGTVVIPALSLDMSPAGATTPTAYTSGTPVVATITNGTSKAPWNEYQGDPNFSAYSSTSPGTVLPTYTPGGTVTTTGGVSEPNVAVFPGSTTATVAGAVPYAAGVVGTPGTLDGYCGTGSDTAEASSTPVRMPNGTTLPLAPAYFPHIVRNSDGDLTGYFDYRPKDADEAIVAATSTDNGQSWTYNGEALEENPSYCPSADTTDDGEGHPNVIAVNGNTYLYTLPRAAGDNVGVGMIVHQFSPTEASPLGNLPATESVGVDPDAFVPTGTASINLTSTSSATIPLTSVGTAGSPEQLIAGSFIDLTANPLPATPVVLNCGVSTSPAELTAHHGQGWRPHRAGTRLHHEELGPRLGQRRAEQHPRDGRRLQSYDRPRPGVGSGRRVHPERLHQPRQRNNLRERRTTPSLRQRDGAVLRQREHLPNKPPPGLHRWFGCLLVLDLLGVGADLRRSDRSGYRLQHRGR
jgi:hypothetical protein